MSARWDGRWWTSGCICRRAGPRIRNAVPRRGFRRSGGATGRRRSWRWRRCGGPWSWAISGPGGLRQTTPSACRRPSATGWQPWGCATSWTCRLALWSGRRNRSGPLRSTGDGVGLPSPGSWPDSGGPWRSAALNCRRVPGGRLRWRRDQGPRSYLFSAQRVRPSSRRKPGEVHWAVYRRNLDGSEPRYYLSNAPEDTPLETLAYVGGSRWRIETEFETEKSDVGLDEYETRTWAGWHHHVALCLLGGAFLLSLQQAWGEKDAPDHEAAGLPGGAGDAAPGTVQPEELLRWLEDTHSNGPSVLRAAMRASPHIPP